MHCMGELMLPIALCSGFKIRREFLVARACDRSHHAVRSDGDDAIRRAQRNFDRP